jgi:hypothetical protein
LKRDEADLVLATEQLHELCRKHEGKRRYYYGVSEREYQAANATGRSGDAFFWKTVRDGFAPGHREIF